MPTFLFDKIVFGPVMSRRLGVSLGVNLLPENSKYCNFDCIYCECGRNPENKSKKLPARTDVYAALENKLSVMQQSGQLPDAITFAGNGEPALHPDFADIIDDVILLRNRYTPQSQITVLSNATMLYKEEVVKALKKIDLPILKLDSAIDATIAMLNQPTKKISAAKLIEQLQTFGNECIIQTMFLKGEYNGKKVDNTTAAELDAWENAVVAIRPEMVTIYSLARDTPIETLNKVSGDTLKNIAQRIINHGIKIQVSE